MHTLKVSLTLLMAVLFAFCNAPEETDGKNSQPSVDTTAANDMNAAEAADAAVNPEIVGKEVTYQADSVLMKGYIAFDKNREGKRPGVLVVHEWWGHNEHARENARMLAEAGFTALAVDMYGNGKQADHPEDASAFSGAVMQDFSGASDRFKAAMELLHRHPSVDTSSTGAVGFCFGGGVALNMARMGANLDAVVSIHGSLGAVEPANAGEVNANILVLTGGADPFVPQDAIDAFKAEMDAAGVNYEVVSYEGAMHAFSNPEATAMGEKFDLPLAYDAKADSLSEEAMVSFLGRHLK